MKYLLLFLFCSLSLFSHEILTYGDAIIDYIVFVDDNLIENQPGETGGSSQIDLETFGFLTKNYQLKCAGGSSINTMKGLSILGHTSKVIGRIGNDTDAEDYLQSIHSYRIIPAFSKCDTHTGRVTCLISPDGYRTMRSCVGISIGFDGFEIAPEDFDGIALFHIEGYQIPNPEFLRELITHAKNAGALISMDMGCHELVNKFKDELLDLIANDLDILFSNFEEARILTGLGPEEACAELSKICDRVVVTCGEKGGYVASKDKLFHYDAIHAELVDDTGAGDCFMAGFLHGVLDGRSLEECAQKGALVASKIIQRMGAELPADLVLEEICICDDHEVRENLVAEDIPDCIECCTGS